MDAVYLRSAKLETLRRREQELRKRISEIEGRQKAQGRRDETREKVLLGACFLADMKIHPETRGIVETVLKRAISAPRDRDFLKARGWL